MKRLTLFLVIVFCFVSLGHAEQEHSVKKNIIIIDSYHKGYNWSEIINKGFSAAMLKLGYFDDSGQTDEFNRNDYVETSKVIVKKLWMDSKRKKSKEAKAKSAKELLKIIRDFNPDLIFLGDDNAAKFLGYHFLDTEVPVVFWGLNNTPVKYDLLDSKEKPGHNITGVYQSGYYIDGLNLLKKITPKVKTFAVLADDSPTGIAMVKALKHFEKKGMLPLKMIETVSTADYTSWKKQVLELQNKVDAFFIAQYNALKDESGKHVPNTKVAKWYLNNVRVPEAAIAGQFVKQGMLCTADDSGYNQGFEAVVIAHDILANGANPANYPPVAPKRGALTINRQRAKMLGIILTKDMGIEKYIESATVLSDNRRKQ